ncbi:hypothetical protein [Lactobacillus sp. ESL0230]|uniref:hypothetical protein n=1 Tax=Lactobacillus sp. ESL0230 TaxID=2069353 RepID=UPI000EFB9773|nr:hypothetical protein [Lactobacillus sp. ESL0230]RMC46717.1 hypothetical protein F5ESL0230_05555 [Lactobacillus sp. ESL0230]
MRNISVSENGICYKPNLDLSTENIEEIKHGYTFMWNNWIYKYGVIINPDEGRKFVIKTSLA